MINYILIGINNEYAKIQSVNTNNIDEVKLSDLYNMLKVGLGVGGIHSTGTNKYTVVKKNLSIPKRTLLGVSDGYTINGTAIKKLPENNSGVYIIPEGVERIEYMERRVVSVVLPTSLISFRGWRQINLFQNCVKLEEIYIPEGIEDISKKCFQGCESLREITIPSTVGHIGMCAFQDCINLKKVIFKSEECIFEKMFLKIA